MSSRKRKQLKSSSEGESDDIGENRKPVTRTTVKTVKQSVKEDALEHRTKGFKNIQG
jgi:hypothetical protein